MPVIEYEKDGKIALFTINRPEKLNALSVEAMREFTDALVDFRDDDALWVGIITGTGTKAFSAGVDIQEYLGLVRDTTDRKWRRPTAIMRGLEIWKPLIAACNGLTIGGGLEISLACDLMVAAEHAAFGLPEVRVGLCPGGGGTVRLPRTVPRRVAAEMLFTGKTIDAQEAYRIGLVNRVVPADRLMAEARSMAETICEAAPLAVRYAKEVMMRSLGMPLDEALRLEDDFATLVMRTEDFAEGQAAFREKRKPRYRGK